MAFWKKKTTDTPKKKKPVWREWLDAGLFAIVAATIIRTFFFEAYTIPTGSMEGTMLINDYLFVSKLAYGPRVPMTPLAVPLVHNTLPVISMQVAAIILILFVYLFGKPFFKRDPAVKPEEQKKQKKTALIALGVIVLFLAVYMNFWAGGKSYAEGVQWKYHRLPGFGHVVRNDVVVFNYPAGDTVLADNPENGDYYTECRRSSRQNVIASHPLIVRPVDKEENYIKRCIGLPGDTVEIKHGRVYINGQPNELFPHSKLHYKVKTSNGYPPSTEDPMEIPDNEMPMPPGYICLNLENSQVDLVKKARNVVSVDLFERDPAGASPREAGEWVFPFDTANYKWNRDNFGPLTIPKEGVTVQLSPQNIAIYRRVIRNYEGNTLDEQDGKIIINGKEVTSYTFKMDYYWMMGDNRHNSLDSRYWGFVPVDHVVGRAAFVWLSYGPEGFFKGMRWHRLFHGIHSLEK